MAPRIRELDRAHQFDRSILPQMAELGRAAGVEKLSMGMSGDFETAIAIGATQVRLGSVLFGGRG